MYFSGVQSLGLALDVLVKLLVHTCSVVLIRFYIIDETKVVTTKAITGVKKNLTVFETTPRCVFARDRKPFECVFRWVFYVRYWFVSFYRVKTIWKFFFYTPRNARRRCEWAGRCELLPPRNTNPFSVFPSLILAMTSVPNVLHPLLCYSTRAIVSYRIRRWTND